MTTRDYFVTATVTDVSPDGWSTTKQIPAFVLPTRTLGIVSREHAETIAREMLAAPGRSVSVCALPRMEG